MKFQVTRFQFFTVIAIEIILIGIIIVFTNRLVTEVSKPNNVKAADQLLLEINR